jgi:hypothetical protein
MCKPHRPDLRTKVYPTTRSILLLDLFDYYKVFFRLITKVHRPGLRTRQFSSPLTNHIGLREHSEIEFVLQACALVQELSPISDTDDQLGLSSLKRGGGGGGGVEREVVGGLSCDIVRIYMIFFLFAHECPEDFFVRALSGPLLVKVGPKPRVRRFGRPTYHKDSGNSDRCKLEYR